MCEWLSCEEWCDVQFLCGGRSFSAHRAVLASVSTFLRRILLSSPDETTTFIVLPDFDLEAMSSVLYYIYNGEIVLQKNKLGLFLEIIKAMQIYIDCQYLSKIEDLENKNFEIENNFESIGLHNDIFTLGMNNDNNQHIFNVKKSKESQKALLKYSHSDSDFHDNGVRCQNESELSESRLGNLKSPYEGRQRSSLLRDLFIETYPPRNRNVNGLTESVLAISNEYYQSPASVLLANVNCRHLSIDDAHTSQSKKAAGHSLHSSAFTAVGRLQNNNKEYGELTTNNIIDFQQDNKYSAITRNAVIFYGKSETFLDNRVPSDPKRFDPEQQVYKDSSHSMFENSLSAKYSSVHKKNNVKSKTSTKVIFNQVLESPWNARKPNNFKPFRRKEKQDVPLASSNTEKHEPVNDTNNNIKNAPLVPEENTNKRISLGEPESVDSASIVENRDIFKCTHCDQVFTTDESLAIHMRRHSSTARYTCGECGKMFSQLRNFKYHMSIHRGTREFAATCSVCGKYFNDRGYLSSHMKIHRNRKEYKCSMCPKSFNQRVAYNMHVRIHTGVKPHVCEECGKAFSRKMLLKQHQRTHSGERPYACPHCDKRFADRSNMTLHLRLHTGVKPFSCPMCPKSFTKKHHLKSHLNFHTGSKPYSCPRCGVAFTQSSNMRTHYKKCTAPEPGSSNEAPVFANSNLV